MMKADSGQTEKWRDTFDHFAREVVTPQRARCDREARFPLEVHREAHKRGLRGLFTPKRYGGLELPSQCALAWGETVGASCIAIGLSLLGSDIALAPVLHAGTEQQKERFIKGTLDRGEVVSLCMTEPDNSGSKLFGVDTQATLQDGRWVIRGRKAMVANAAQASLFVVLARTTHDAGPSAHAFFVVPRSERVLVSARGGAMGLRAVATAHVEFDHVEVPSDHCLRTAGSSLDLVHSTLAELRFFASALALGISLGAIRDITPWLRERRVFPDQALIDKSNVQLTLGSYLARRKAICALFEQAADLRDRGLPYDKEVVTTKLLATELAVEVTNQVVQYYGWRGVSLDMEAEKRLRDARTTTIQGGASPLLERQVFSDFLAGC